MISATDQTDDCASGIKLFISYSSRDKSVAEALDRDLGSEGFDIWRDEREIGRDWSREIALAVADSDVLLLVWSVNAERSKWVRNEWLTARAMETHVLPYLLPDAPGLPEQLASLHGFNHEDAGGGFAKLAQRIRRLLDIRPDYDFRIQSSRVDVPFEHNAQFVGRRGELLELFHMSVGGLRKAGTRAVGVVGMGGVGKTQLASEFAHRFGFAFEGGVFWTQARDVSGWPKAFADLARDLLPLDQVNKDDEEDIAALKSHLSSTQSSPLVIMDDVENPEDLLDDRALFGISPVKLGVNILFTTQRAFELTGVEAYHLRVLPAGAAYTLLTHRRRPTDMYDAELARCICNVVGYLPLALVLIAAYLGRYKNVSYGQYMEMLTEAKLDTIDVQRLSEKQLATRHVTAVRFTIRNQWRRLSDAPARLVFRLAGQLPEAAIVPKARLGLLAGLHQRDADRHRPLDDACLVLFDLCLAEEADGASGLRLHPLVHAFARKMVPDAKPFCAAAARRLREATTEVARLEDETRARGIHEVLGDLQVGIEWWGGDPQTLEELQLLEATLRLAAKQLTRSPSQLVENLLGRLSPSWSSGIGQLLENAVAAKSGAWLRPLIPTMARADGPIRYNLPWGVYALASRMARDNEELVCAGFDNTITIRDFATAKVIVPLGKHEDAVKAIAVSRDGRFAASGSWDQTVKIWDLEAGRELHTLEGHTGRVLCVSFSHDGEHVVSGAEDNLVRVWNRGSGEELCTFSGHEDSVLSVVVTSNGRVVSSSQDGSLKVWDLSSAAEVRTLVAQAGRGMYLALSPDEQRVVSTSDDGTLKVWRLSNGALERTLVGHWGSATAVAVMPDGRHVLSGSVHGVLMRWSLDSGVAERSFQGHADQILSIAPLDDGRRAATSSFDRTIKIWDLGREQADSNYPQHVEGVTHAMASPTGRYCVTFGGDTIVWDLMFPGDSRLLEIADLKVAGFRADGKTLTSISGHHRIGVWDLERGVGNAADLVDLPAVYSAEIDSRGRIAIAALSNGSLAMWELGDELRLFALDRPARRIAISADGNTGASVLESDIDVWDLRHPRWTRTLRGHTREIIALWITADGHWLISSCIDQSVRVWDLDAGEEWFELPPRDGGLVVHATTTTDSRIGILGCFNGEIRVVDLSRGAEQFSFRGHNELITGLAVSPNGEFLISSSWDHTLKVWELQTGRIVASFEGEGQLWSCAIGLDGRTVVAGERSGRVHLLRLEGV